MKRETGETIIKAFAVVSWLEAVALLAIGCALLFAGPALGGVIAQDAPLFGSALSGAGYAAALALLAVGAIYLIAGAGLWAHRSWARLLALALAVASLLAVPFGTMVGLIAIWFLGFNDKIKELFSGARY